MKAWKSRLTANFGKACTRSIPIGAPMVKAKVHVPIIVMNMEWK